MMPKYVVCVFRSKKAHDFWKMTLFFSSLTTVMSVQKNEVSSGILKHETDVIRTVAPGAQICRYKLLYQSEFSS